MQIDLFVVVVVVFVVIGLAEHSAIARTTWGTRRELKPNTNNSNTCLPTSANSGSRSYVKCQCAVWGDSKNEDEFLRQVLMCCVMWQQERRRVPTSSVNVLCEVTVRIKTRHVTSPCNPQTLQLYESSPDIWACTFSRKERFCWAPRQQLSAVHPPMKQMYSYASGARLSPPWDTSRVRWPSLECLQRGARRY